MKHRTGEKLLTLVILVSVQFIGLFTLKPADVVNAQSYPPFLITPYYGHASVNSWFDHWYPGSQYDNDYLVTYYGKERYNPDPRYCTSGWNGNCYDTHFGIDFGLSYQQVLAAADGTVKYVGWYSSIHNEGLGLYVEIEHAMNGITYRTRYAHLSTVAVKKDQIVSAGKIIGTSGNTGQSSNPHLHFDISQKVGAIYKFIDPFGWDPEPGADYTQDPWANYSSGMYSWCMWSDGEWVNLCDPSIQSRPLPQPLNGGEFIVNDTVDNSSGFSKGYGGRWNNTCAGIDPACKEWYETINGIGGHTYFTTANGYSTEDNWAKWQPPFTPSVGANYSEIYEIFVNIPTISGKPNETFTWQAKFKVRAADLLTYETIVDEYLGRDLWLSIGMYYLDADSYVYVTDATGENKNTHCPSGPEGWCRMTVDAVKFVRRGVAHLSNVYTTGGGTESLVAIYNNGGGPASVKVSPFNATGAYCGLYSNVIAPGDHKIFSMSNGGIASARVSASQDVIVVVENQYNTGGDYAYNGVATEDPLNPGWGQLGATLYAPVNMNNYWGWYSNLYLYNPSNNATVDVLATDESGDTISPPDIYVPVNNLLLYAPFGLQNKLYAAKITNDASAKLSALVTQYNGNNWETYNAFSSGATVYHAPLIMSSYYGWNTSVNIQNITSSTASVIIEYRKPDRTIALIKTYSLPGNRTKSLYSPDEGLPDLDLSRPGNNFIGSAYIASTKNVVVVVNQSNISNPRGLSYSSVSAGSNFVILPDILHHVNDLTPGGTGNENWASSINIRNLEAISTTVTVDITNWCSLSTMLEPYGAYSWTLTECGSGSHRGPGIVFTEDGSKVSVVVNHSSSNLTNDLAHSYTGVNR
jgi:murein DD-endopeptidase MepM/ murein hydrolase activator NlpD